MGYPSLSVLIISVIIASCAYDPNLQRDFDFPIERGNVEEGRQAFIALGCHQCHSVANTELPDFPIYTLLRLELGGPTTGYKSNAQLMTSIISPNHNISEEYWDLVRLDVAVLPDSPMPNFDFMTVAQLIDIVAFLDSKYQFIDMSDEE